MRAIGGLTISVVSLSLLFMEFGLAHTGHCEPLAAYKTQCQEFVALVQAARSARTRHQFSEALAHASKVHPNQECPAEFLAAINIAAQINAFDLKNYDKAIMVCKAGLSVFPDDMSLTYIKAYAHVEKNEFEQAISDLGQITRHYPLASPPSWEALYEVYRLMALAYERLGHTSKNSDSLRNSLSWWEKALKIASDQHETIDPTEATKHVQELRARVSGP